ncbi:conserved hypothetical protein [Roseateles sp. YR242]|uniref:YybH family protein n=1 Tax=Roseateles sp. YR242 TaxID=1855305 RepID=UPI0008CD7CE5|nr:nuclear transport factor 2 family protein [Roseateles sp. YR242]SEL52107.1 conserved hypothetical protein [Roseateles sp. YR242]
MDLQSMVLARLRDSDEAWARGDVPAFMSIFAPEVTSVSASGISIGHSTLASRLVHAYGVRLDGSLVTTVEEIRTLADDIATVCGRFELHRVGAAGIHGCFSQVWLRDAQSLRVVLDHATLSPGPNP